jgi:hypothetical protein
MRKVKSLCLIKHNLRCMRVWKYRFTHTQFQNWMEVSSQFQTRGRRPSNNWLGPDKTYGWFWYHDKEQNLFPGGNWTLFDKPICSHYSDWPKSIRLEHSQGTDYSETLPGFPRSFQAHAHEYFLSHPFHFIQQPSLQLTLYMCNFNYCQSHYTNHKSINKSLIQKGQGK